MWVRVCLCTFERKKAYVCMLMIVCRRVSEHIQERDNSTAFVCKSVGVRMYVWEKVGLHMYSCSCVCTHLGEKETLTPGWEGSWLTVCVCVHAWHRKLHHMCMCVRESVCVYTLWQRTPDVYIYVCVSQGLCITVIDRFFIQHYSLDQTHCTRVACDSEWETVSFL